MGMLVAGRGPRERGGRRLEVEVNSFSGGWEGDDDDNEVHIYRLLEFIRCCY